MPLYIPLALVASLGFQSFASLTAAQSSVVPGGVHKVEAALCPWNKLLRLFLQLADERSGEGLVNSCLIRSGDSFEASDFGDESFSPSLASSGLSSAMMPHPGEAVGRYTRTVVTRAQLAVTKK